MHNSYVNLYDVMTKARLSHCPVVPCREDGNRFYPRDVAKRHSMVRQCDILL